MNGWTKSVAVIVSVAGLFGGAVAYADNNFVRKSEYQVLDDKLSMVQKEIKVSRLQSIESEIWEWKDRVSRQPNDTQAMKRLHDLMVKKRVLCAELGMDCQ